MKKAEQGSLLISVIVAIVVIAALGVGIASMVTTGVRSNTDNSLSIQALYLAESGFEWSTFKLRENNATWENYCNSSLANDGKRICLKNNRCFTILSSKTDDDACKINILGWIGSSNKELSLASRRLEGTIPGWFIEDSELTTANMFSGGNKDWKQRTGNVEFQNGDVVFIRPGQGQGQGSKAQTNAPASVIQEFEEDDDIFFGAYVKDLEDISSHSFILDVHAAPGIKIDCLINFNGNPQLTSSCDSSSMPSTHLSEMLKSYNLIFYLGNGLQSGEFKDLTLTLDWEHGDQDEITFKYGCLGPPKECSQPFHEDYITIWQEN